MHELVAEGLRLGALGFSTDQVVGNIGPGNTALPGQVCGDAELLAIARTLGAGPGPGLFTMAPRALLLDREQRLEDLAWHELLAETSGKPVVIGPVFDTFDDPGVGRDLLDAMAAAQAARASSGRPGVAAPVRAVDPARRAGRARARAADVAARR